MVELDGRRLHAAFSSGAARVIRIRRRLDEINVFPVADGDTGSNLAATLASMASVETVSHNAGIAMGSMAEAAMIGARGNSGVIFAQFLEGFRAHVADAAVIGVEHFVHGMEKAARSAAAAISRPREGTIVSVIRDWAEALRAAGQGSGSIRELLRRSIPAAEESLRRTPERLPELARAGVVDAGAMGFVEFLKGAREYIETGREAVLERQPVVEASLDHAVFEGEEAPTRRYCAEAVIRGAGLDRGRIVEVLEPLGDSVIVALAGGDLARIHAHVDDPALVFDRLRPFGKPIQQKVDDMRLQFECLRAPGRKIALLTDSTCDLPPDVLDRHRVFVVPMIVNFGEVEYLDRVTLSTERFFELAEGGGPFPRTSQPSIAAFRRAYAFLAAHYESIIAIHVSSKLSGTYEGSRRAAAELAGTRITVIDSKTLSGSLGLLVERAAEAVEAGRSHDDVAAEIEASIPKAGILVAVPTLKYMVRGGRVSPLKGLAARFLNLKPIVSLDADGASTLSGKAFSMRATLRKIAARVRAESEAGGLRAYAVVHGDAPGAAADFAAALEDELGRPPAYVMPISPVIGLNAGKGSLAVVTMLE